MEMVKKATDTTNYFYVDESGDPTFYDRYGNFIVGNDGISKILILGFIKTNDPKLIRQRLLQLQEEIRNDKYLRGVPSLQKSLVAFHAKDDCPEVRERVFKMIVELDFSAEVFVARKIQNIFNITHHRNEGEFYDDLVTKLFQNKLHLAKNNEVYFAVRGTRVRQAPLEHALQMAVKLFETKWNTKVETTTRVSPQSPSGEPCLQVIDYVNWAIQRAFVKHEDRFYKFIEDKASYLVDIYDTDKYPKNFYNKKSNRFDISKISPL